MILAVLYIAIDQAYLTESFDPRIEAPPSKVFSPPDEHPDDEQAIAPYFDSYRYWSGILPLLD